MKSTHINIYSLKPKKARKRCIDEDRRRLKLISNRISRSLSSRHDTDASAVLSLAQLYISRRSSVQEPLYAFNESAVLPVPTQEPSMHSLLPSTPSVQPSPLSPLWDPPNDESGHSGEEICENNNQTTMSRLDTNASAVLSLAQLYISRRSSVQEPLMHSPLPSPQMIQPSLPFSRLWNPLNNESRNNDEEICENNNQTTTSSGITNTEIMAANYEANHNLVRHYVQNYSQYSNLQH